MFSCFHVFLRTLPQRWLPLLYCGAATCDGHDQTKHRVFLICLSLTLGCILLQCKRLTPIKLHTRATRLLLRHRPHQLPAIMNQRIQFHASTKREEETKPALVEDKGVFSWDPLYSIPLGIALAVPIIHYEFYVVNEETQLAACFIFFNLFVYTQFGDTIKEFLSADGKEILAKQNAVEDEILGILKSQRQDVLMQENLVQDFDDIQALKAETYEKLNAVGKVKPLHEFKSQVERMLTLIATEESNVKEKQKVAMMEEATAAVTQELLTNKALQKQSLENAIKKLKGESAGEDPVKSTYLKFFKWKAEEATKIDAKAEVAEARAAMVAKLNAVADNEGFYFKFGQDGKPVMTV